VISGAQYHVRRRGKAEQGRERRHVRELHHRVPLEPICKDIKQLTVNPFLQSTRY